VTIAFLRQKDKQMRQQAQYETDVLVVGGGPAGTAAALSIKHGVCPRAVDVGALQTSLRAGGAILDENDIAEANSKPQFWEQ